MISACIRQDHATVNTLVRAESDGPGRRAVELSLLLDPERANPSDRVGEREVHEHERLVAGGRGRHVRADQHVLAEDLVADPDRHVGGVLEQPRRLRRGVVHHEGALSIGGRQRMDDRNERPIEACTAKKGPPPPPLTAPLNPSTRQPCPQSGAGSRRTARRGPSTRASTRERGRAEHVPHVLPTLCGLGCRPLAELRYRAPGRVAFGYPPRGTPAAKMPTKASFSFAASGREGYLDKTASCETARLSSPTPPRCGSRRTGGVVGWGARRAEVSVALPT